MRVDIRTSESNEAHGNYFVTSDIIFVLKLKLIRFGFLEVKLQRKRKKFTLWELKYEFKRIFKNFYLN